MGNNQNTNSLVPACTCGKNTVKNRKATALLVVTLQLHSITPAHGKPELQIKSTSFPALSPLHAERKEKSDKGGKTEGAWDRGIMLVISEIAKRKTNMAGRMSFMQSVWFPTGESRLKVKNTYKQLFP